MYSNVDTSACDKMPELQSLTTWPSPQSQILGLKLLEFHILCLEQATLPPSPPPTIPSLPGNSLPPWQLPHSPAIHPDNFLQQFPTPSTIPHPPYLCGGIKPSELQKDSKLHWEISHSSQILSNKKAVDHTLRGCRYCSPYGKEVMYIPVASRADNAICCSPCTISTISTLQGGSSNIRTFKAGRTIQAHLCPLCITVCSIPTRYMSAKFFWWTVWPLWAAGAFLAVSRCVCATVAWYWVWALIGASEKQCDHKECILQVTATHKHDFWRFPKTRSNTLW